MAENKLKIFVEGKTDIKFISDYLSHLNVITAKNNFIDCNGKDKLIIGGYNQFIKDYTDQGFQNVIIFDADNSYENRRQELEDLKTNNNLIFDYFLFPNNNSQGEIEDLLFEIVNEKHKAIFNCFNNFTNCLEDQYSKPNKEAKVFAYLDAILPKNRKEEMQREKRNYLDTDIWDLTNEYLSPLKDFLLKYST